MASRPVLSQEQMLAETSRALERMRPGRVLTRFAVETGVCWTMFAGMRIWSDGGLAGYGPRAAVGDLAVSMVIAAMSRISEFRQVWKYLRTTHGEAVEQIRSDLRMLKGPWWPLKIGGVGAAVGSFLGVFVGVLGAIIDPQITLGAAVGQSLALMVPVVAVFFMILRFPMVARMERVTEVDPPPDRPGEA